MEDKDIAQTSPNIEPNIEPNMQCRGIVFDIQRYTVHDGPGTRTSVFLKGCTLKCLWCCNPESQAKNPEVGVYPNRCIGVDKCGLCLEACHLDAAKVFTTDEEGKVTGIDRKLCDNCFKCVDECPADGLGLLGREMTVAELLKEIEKDREFFEATGGGVTISGGELFVQPLFSLELLKACKRAGLHTCIETALCVPWQSVEQALPFIDFIITDIKHMDPDKHRQYTGGRLDLVLDNIKKLRDWGKQTIIRIPLIPGHNDDEENIRATGEFIANECGQTVQQVQVLQFHELGKNKYLAINQDYPLAGLKKPKKKDYLATMKRAVDILAGFGLPAHADSKLVMNR